MGAIKEDDIDSYILKIKDTLFNFNNSYLNKEYKKMIINLNLFIMKISNIYLTKLKTNIDLVASKFSTILTKDIYMQLKNKFFEQYNDIEAYIQKYSKLIEICTNDFSVLLNDSSKLVKLSYDITLNRVKGYYQILSELIQLRLKLITKEEKKEYKLRILNYRKDYPNKSVGQTLDSLKNFDISCENDKNFQLNNFSNEHYDEGTKYNITTENNNETNNGNNNKINDDNNNENKQGDNNNINNNDNDDQLDFDEPISYSQEENNKKECTRILDKTKELKKFIFSVNFPIYTGLLIGISFKPEMNLDLCYEKGHYKDLDNQGEYIGISAVAEVEISLDFGIYIPFASCPLSFSVNIGLVGLLGSGTIGIKLEIFLTKKKVMSNSDSFFDLNPCDFYFFVRFQFNLNLFFSKLSYEFYLVRKNIKSLAKSGHNKLSDQ